MNITKKAFIGWLHNKEDSEVVGVAGDPCICPIASFLNEEVGDCLYVNSRNVVYARGNREYTKQLPLWAKNFVVGVDRAFNQGEVTVEDAFEVLDATHPTKGTSVPVSDAMLNDWANRKD